MSDAVGQTAQIKMRLLDELEDIAKCGKRLFSSRAGFGQSGNAAPSAPLSLYATSRQGGESPRVHSEVLQPDVMPKLQTRLHLLHGEVRGEPFATISKLYFFNRLHFIYTALASTAVVANLPGRHVS